MCSRSPGAMPPQIDGTDAHPDTSLDMCVSIRRASTLRNLRRSLASLARLLAAGAAEIIPAPELRTHAPAPAPHRLLLRRRHLPITRATAPFLNQRLPRVRSPSAPTPPTSPPRRVGGWRSDAGGGAVAAAAAAATASSTVRGDAEEEIRAARPAHPLQQRRAQRRLFARRSETRWRGSAATSSRTECFRARDA